MYNDDRNAKLVLKGAEKDIKKLLNIEVEIKTNDDYGYNENIENKYVVIEVATKSKIATFSMTGLPGCCGVCVSHYSRVANQFQGKGLGKLLCGIRKDIAKTMRYSCLLCTDVDDNLPQQRILDRHGWKKVHNFKNIRTGSLININVVDL